MVRAIREYAQQTGMAVGFKPAGGIRTAKQSIDWLAMMREELGVSWMRAEAFRFGASGLLGDIERQLEPLRHRPILSGLSPSPCLRKLDRRWPNQYEKSATRKSERSSMSIADKFVAMEYGPAPEDPKEAMTWLERHGRRFGLFIGGAWRPPAAEISTPYILQTAKGWLRLLKEELGISTLPFARRGLLLQVEGTYSARPAPLSYALARLVQKHSRLLAVSKPWTTASPSREP